MIKLVVIADDLTGALDTGAQFSKKKLSTIVSSKITFDEIYHEYDVVVVNTESRHLDSIEAKKIVKKIVKEFSNKNIEFFYKKIDSTLRGNLGSELEGFMEALSISKLSLIPSFPSGNRIVKNGILYVNGIPLSETQFSRDILNPIKDSYIPNILKEQTSMNIKLQESSNLLEELKESEKNICLFDASNMIELKKIGDNLFQRKMLKYTAGSAGFAEILAQYIVGKSKIQVPELKDDRVLFICGSINDVSLKQCQYAESLGYITEVLEFEDIINNSYKESSNYLPQNKAFKRKIKEAKNILIKTSNSINVINEANEYAKTKNISIKSITSNISKNTGQLVADLIMEYDLRNLIVFGGDTLSGILKTINCELVIPFEEIVPGVVLTRAINKNKEINIITKAGGFGDIDIIDKIHNFLRERTHF